MTNDTSASQNNTIGELQEKEVNRLIVEPIANLIKEQAAERFERDEAFLDRLQQIEDLIDIIARHVGGDCDCLR
jgi:hypothetical protein